MQVPAHTLGRLGAVPPLSSTPVRQRVRHQSRTAKSRLRRRRRDSRVFRRNPRAGVLSQIPRTAAARFPDPFRRALLADIVFLITFVMLAIGLFTTIQWPALFPTLRDYLALAGLPLRMRQILSPIRRALRSCSGILLTLTLAPSFILPAISRGKFLPGTFFHIPALFVASYLAGIFVFFTLLALEGILLNVTPVRHFPRVSLAIQGLLVALLVGGLPLSCRFRTSTPMSTCDPSGSCGPRLYGSWASIK